LQRSEPGGFPQLGALCGCGHERGERGSRWHGPAANVNGGRCLSGVCGPGGGLWVGDNPLAVMGVQRDAFVATHIDGMLSL